MQRGLQAQMRQFPGQEKQLIDYYRRNPEALASIRAPIFEEKVVDFLLELVKVTDKPVSREELLREEEDDRFSDFVRHTGLASSLSPVAAQRVSRHQCTRATVFLGEVRSAKGTSIAAAPPPPT